MADYAKRQLKALDRIAKKIADAEGHLTKIEDSVDNEKHRTAQHETIKDIKSILKHAWKVDKDSVKLEERAGEGRKDPAENHYVYMEDEEGVIKDLNKEFKELDEKLAALTDDEGARSRHSVQNTTTLKRQRKFFKRLGSITQMTKTNL